MSKIGRDLERAVDSALKTDVSSILQRKSNSIGDSLEAFLQEKSNDILQKAGLPTNLLHIIGRPYMFVWKELNEHRIIAGTIQAIEIMFNVDRYELIIEEGLIIYVSNQYFGSSKLVALKYSNNKWRAVVRILPNEDTLIPGKLRLL